jgi:hypothetical protein
MINNYLDVNTRFFHPDDLNDDESVLNTVYRIADYNEGSFYWVPLEDDENLPKYINDMFTYAIDNNCAIIRADQDGDDECELKDFIDDWD